MARSARNGGAEDFTEVSGPYWFDEEQVEQMDTATRPAEDDEVRLFAVAGLEGSVGGERIETVRNAVCVLYMDADGNHAVERVETRASVAEPHTIPASILLPEDHYRLSEPTTARYRQAQRGLAAHQRTWVEESDAV